MKYKKELDSTTNSRIYKVALKHYLASICEISCSRCPYHRWENSGFGRGLDSRSWKKYRKQQYKKLGV